MKECVSYKMTTLYFEILTRDKVSIIRNVSLPYKEFDENDV